MSGRPVAHFEILGANPGQLRQFYTGIFGWSVKHPPQAGDPQDYAMITTNSGEASIDGGIGEGLEGATAVTFYINVDDLGATLAAVEAGGGRVVMAPTQVAPGGVSIAKFSDPQGNIVGLVSE